MPDDLGFNRVSVPMVEGCAKNGKREIKAVHRSDLSLSDVASAGSAALEMLAEFAGSTQAQHLLALANVRNPEAFLRRLSATIAPVPRLGAPFLRFAALERSLGGKGEDAVLSALELRRAMPFTLHVCTRRPGLRELFLMTLLGAADAAVALGRRTRVLDHDSDLGLAFYYAMRGGAKPVSLSKQPMPSVRRVRLGGRKAHAILRTRADIVSEGPRDYLPT